MQPQWSKNEVVARIEDLLGVKTKHLNRAKKKTLLAILYRLERGKLDNIPDYVDNPRTLDRMVDREPPTSINIVCRTCNHAYNVLPATEMGHYSSRVDFCEKCESSDLERIFDNGMPVA